MFWCCVFCFFFQAEDGIRDGHVTGVQTCALPISELGTMPRTVLDSGLLHSLDGSGQAAYVAGLAAIRSEERRVGKECRSRWAPDHEKKREGRDEEQSRGARRRSEDGTNEAVVGRR